MRVRIGCLARALENRVFVAQPAGAFQRGYAYGLVAAVEAGEQAGQGAAGTAGHSQGVVGFTRRVQLMHQLGHAAQG